MAAIAIARSVMREVSSTVAGADASFMIPLRIPRHVGSGFQTAERQLRYAMAEPAVKLLRAKLFPLKVQSQEVAHLPQADSLWKDDGPRQGPQPPWQGRRR